MSLQETLAKAESELAAVQEEAGREWCMTLIWPRIQRLRRRKAMLRFAAALDQPQAIIFLVRKQR